MKIIDLSNKEFYNYLDEKIKTKELIIISTIGWQDGDYFQQMCNEDGGIDNECFEIFKKMKLGEKIGKDELKCRILIYNKFPFLHSINSNYKYYYDIHIWTNNNYIIYNFFLNKIIIKKTNFFEKLMHPVINTNWKF
jgi:hypothetical protein